LNRRRLFSFFILTLLFYFAAAIADAQPAMAPSRSIRNWTHCDGKTDDDAGVIAAFAAAKNDAFTLVIDCPVFIHVGMDIRHPIFIDSGTTVQFTTNGLFKVDNVQVPAFVIANSVHIRLLGWRIQYTGQEPVNKTVAGYYDNGTLVQNKGYQPSSQFNDRTLTSWLSTNRAVHFAQATPWGGITNTSAIFFLVGSTKDVVVDNFKAFVASNAKGSQFIPMVFSSILGGNSNGSYNHQMLWTSEHYSIPSNITFSNIDLDGYYMGWQGQFQNATFEHIRAHRYGDLQDDQGGNVGGVDKWFAPPHLIYLNYDPAHTGLENRNIRILDVIDYGIRVGVARDRGGSDSSSGYANSLKIGAIDSVVDGYKSYRPDGFLDILTSRNLKIANVDATYDSSFLNNIYPGIRFPQAPYQQVTFENIRLADKAAITQNGPIWGTYSAANSQITMTNVKVTLNKWAKALANPGPKALASICPPFGGTGHKIDIQYIISGQVQDCHIP
jgi:hypothetical protein